MWTLIISKDAFRFMERLGGKDRKYIENAFRDLTIDPHSGKPLKGDLKGYWSMRVGVYRIIYVVRETQILIEVLRISHRKEVYERLRR